MRHRRLNGWKVVSPTLLHGRYYHLAPKWLCSLYHGCEEYLGLVTTSATAGKTYDDIHLYKNILHRLVMNLKNTNISN